MIRMDRRIGYCREKGVKEEGGKEREKSRAGFNKRRLPRMYDQAEVREYMGMETKYSMSDRERENQQREEGGESVAHWLLLQGMSPGVAMTTETE